MPNKKHQVSEVKIKQVFLLLLIIILASLVGYHLSLFVPALLGAITLYVITRKYNLYLQEQKHWKPWVASLVIIFGTLIVLILPIYFIVDLLIEKLGNASAYMQKFNVFIDKIHDYIYTKTNIDILSKDNLTKLKDNVGKFSTSALSGTFNTLTVVASMYFILYFMLEKPRFFERLMQSSAPLKKANVNLLGEKIRKMVMANAIGIPVVAIGQGVIALIGYLIFGAPSAILLFALTCVGSMLPIVGAAIIYIPVCIFMIAEGNVGPGLGLATYCVVVVGLTDNLLRFTLLKKLENIHPLNTVFGIIMGINLFGFMGLIFGPILISITIMLIQVYRDEFFEDDREIIMPEPKEIEQKIDLSI
ncbi:AI-2E family transporter [Kaistella antarctica]|uniref:Permease n=1 Tax=Kaistella antarctica TaxID=266748 RepID=A0A3S4UMW1_9FLAO|nr:AI-2E family transporter [Kaistella antarctica]KEY17891.1 permease [Kaistella antarctica]SEV80843.1 Predicted PurR-regulated permease PerM [Kaistella antarctica]VEI00211.1 putative inner membrane protein [Kaistella antarctica]